MSLLAFGTMTKKNRRAMVSRRRPRLVERRDRLSPGRRPSPPVYRKQNLRGENPWKRTILRAPAVRGLRIRVRQGARSASARTAENGTAGEKARMSTDDDGPARAEGIKVSTPHRYDAEPNHPGAVVAKGRAPCAVPAVSAKAAACLVVSESSCPPRTRICRRRPAPAAAIASRDGRAPNRAYDLGPVNSARRAAVELLNEGAPQPAIGMGGAAQDTSGRRCRPEVAVMAFASTWEGGKRRRGLITTANPG